MSNDILEDIGLKIQELVMAEFQNALTSDWFSRSVRDEVEAVYEDGHCECCDQGAVKEDVLKLKEDVLKLKEEMVGQLVTGLEKRVTELEGKQ